LLQPMGGRIVLAGIVVTLIGIALVARAGRRKELELSREEQTRSVSEFNYRKGLAVGTFSGILSSCFAYGVAAGAPIRALGAEAGTGSLWRGLPVLCIVLAGGFTTNFLWCLALIVKNRSGGEWLGRPGGATSSLEEPPPLARNYFLCAVGGLLWYFQFFFYTMGESQMGRYGFSSWTLHMASIIIFSTVWGFALKEWSGACHRTRNWVWVGIATLVGATVIIGYGNSLVR
jgi:L-rhamnose-H+ transport protein